MSEAPAEPPTSEGPQGSTAPAAPHGEARAEDAVVPPRSEAPEIHTFTITLDPPQPTSSKYVMIDGVKCFAKSRKPVGRPGGSPNKSASCHLRSCI